ncbi:uncharacterized protein OCT59_007565 [Rhizophagus irregularis]|uniref:uncharacterized protein n=1 Tax=Rhizophagus irregularis TaxID=588596 RepID=UPI003325F831|nr:hypothetical protein OCT59_007565 [Rhizophagus irregularis]
MPVCESGTASPSKLEEIIIELMLFTMPRFSILKTRTRSSVRNLGVEKVSIAKVEQDSSVVDVFQYPEDSLPSRDIKPVNIVNEFSENSKLTHKIEETDIVTYFTNLKKLANLFYQANNAKKSTIKSKRTEISSWCCYSERFEDKVMELRSDKKLTDQTTYNEMKPFLTGVSDGYLHYMTCKARKINKLFGYEYDPVSLEKNNDQVNSKTVNMLTIRVMTSILRYSGEEESQTEPSNSDSDSDYDESMEQIHDELTSPSLSPFPFIFTFPFPLRPFVTKFLEQCPKWFGQTNCHCAIYAALTITPPDSTYP